MTTIAEQQLTTTDWVDLAHRLGAQFEGSVAECDRTGDTNRAAFEQLKATGLSAAMVPEEFGGGGASHEELGAVLRALAFHDPATAVTFSMHSHAVAFQVWRHRHGMDATGVFGKVVSDRLLLLSTGGSDWIASSGQGVRTEGGYVVNARKSPVSGAEVGDIAVTSFRFVDTDGITKVAHCSIPMSAPGVSIERTWDTLGLRATGSHTVVFTDVFVADAQVSLVRTADQWHPVWNAILGAAMPLIMSAYMGIADRAVTLAVDAVGERDDVMAHQLLGEILNTQLAASDALAAMYADSANLTFPNADRYGACTLARKTTVTDHVIATVRLALEAVGGRAFLRTSELERLYRDAHGALYHPLPRAKQTMFSGRVLAGRVPL
ncbi:MAG: acyl-CoA dehydrogenase family protein [Acidimicrobiia bacterium]